MIFIETPIFTEDLIELLTDDEYSKFQNYRATNPTVGEVIQHTGGLRKVRWVANGKGKRGGVRVIYYHVTVDSQIRLLLIYRKGIKDDRTEKEKKILCNLNEGW